MDNRIAMPAHHIGDIIGAEAASRFGHPDLLHAELDEAAEYVRLLDQQHGELEAGLALIAGDPELDDIEAHTEMEFQRQIMAAVVERRDAEMRRAIAARERLEGTPARAPSFWRHLRDGMGL